MSLSKLMEDSVQKIYDKLREANISEVEPSQDDDVNDTLSRSDRAFVISGTARFKIEREASQLKMDQRVIIWSPGKNRKDLIAIGGVPPLISVKITRENNSHGIRIHFSNLRDQPLDVVANNPHITSMFHRLKKEHEVEIVYINHASRSNDNKFVYADIKYKFFIYPNAWTDNPGRTIEQDLQKAFDNGNMADVVIKCPDGEFEAHKVILAMRSEYFSAMFSSNNKESLSGIVEIPNVNMVTMKLLVKFLYTGKISPDEINADLLIASEEFLVPDLYAICEKLLIESVDIDNVIHCLLIGVKHKIPSLRGAAASFIVSNMDTVKSLTEWTELRKTHPEIAFDLMEEFCSTFKKSLEVKND